MGKNKKSPQPGTPLLTFFLGDFNHQLDIFSVNLHVARPGRGKFGCGEAGVRKVWSPHAAGRERPSGVARGPPGAARGHPGAALAPNHHFCNRVFNKKWSVLHKLGDLCRRGSLGTKPKPKPTGGPPLHPNSDPQPRSLGFSAPA